jgi:salicylate hydroxylase
MKAIVVGGGIGGATASLALLREGIEVEQYEQASEFGELGAGLQMSANAVRVLEKLGVGDQLRDVGVVARAVDFRDLGTDELLHHTPLDDSGSNRLGAEFIQAQRPDLLNILVAQLPEEVVHLGERFVEFDQDADGVTAMFASGHTARADLLVGADGIHSTVRGQILGDTRPEFSKIIAWRALIPHERLTHLEIQPKCHVWWAPHRSVVLYWVRHMRLLNFVGIVPSEEAQAESWTARGEVGAIRESFRGCTEQVAQIIEQIQEPFVTGYYFRRPLPRWSSGRVTLLGDCAHPMHPFLAQGACQAIEDAAVLSRLLARSDGPASVPRALRDYQDKRMPRASRIQRSSMDQERIWHMADPKQIAVRNRQLKSMMDIDPASRALFGWIHAHDPYALADDPYKKPWQALRRPQAQRAGKMWYELATPQDLARGHPGLRDAYHRFFRTNFPAAHEALVERTCAGDIRITRVRSDATTEQAPRLLHLHGGGYVCGSADDCVDLAYRLARVTGGVVDAPEYRLAPEHPFPAAVEDAVCAYRWLLDCDGVLAQQVVLTGESAGGALAIATALLAEARGLPPPAGIVALCPMADLCLGGETIDTCADTDPICTREFLTNMASLYLQGHDPADPLASPLYADLRGLAPLLVQVATNEALFSDAHRLVTAARSADVPAELDTYEDSVHVFSLFDFLPEARRSLDRVAEFVRTVIAS